MGLVLLLSKHLPEVTRIADLVAQTTYVNTVKRIADPI
jgi:hypothetical protein